MAISDFLGIILDYMGKKKILADLGGYKEGNLKVPEVITDKVEKSFEALPLRGKTKDRVLHI